MARWPIGRKPLTRKEIDARYRAKHKVRRKEASRWYQMKLLYRLTKEQFYVMLANQQGRCAICSIVMQLRGRTSNCICVDHDHVTQAVRGLLCRTCNTGLGYFQDSGTMHRAAEYLAKHE